MRKVILMMVMISSIFGANIIFNGNVDNQKLNPINLELEKFLVKNMNATKVVYKDDIASKQEALKINNADVALFIRKIGKSLSITITSASGASDGIYLKKSNNYNLNYFEKDLSSTIKYLLEWEVKNKSFSN